MSAEKKPGFFDSLVSPLTGAGQLRLEKARLEAFLAAVPGEYCGFAPGKTVVYSRGFSVLLGLHEIRDVHDIQNALSPGDSAALEGMFIRLQEQGKPFSLTVQNAGRDKTFRLSGSQGQALDGQDRFDILWIEDISEQHGILTDAQNKLDLAQSETARLQNAMDEIPALLWMRNDSGDIHWCNRFYAEQTDISPAEIVAKQKEVPVTSKVGGVTLRDLSRQALTGGTIQKIQSHIILNGARRLADIHEIPLPSSSGTLGFAVDITREEELDTELKRYVSANKELLEQLRTAIGIYNPDHSLEFYNAAYAQLWGLEDQWLNTRPKLGNILEKLRESRRLPEEADFRKYKQSWLDMFTSLIDPHEDMMYLPDGSVLRILVVPHPMGGLMMTFEDVTSRLELESSYNTLIAVQKETLDNLAEGVAVYGGDGRLKLWNPSFAELWGVHPEDLEGEPHISKLVDKMSGFFEEGIRAERCEQLIAQGLDRTIQEGRMPRLNGTLLEFTTVPLPDGGVLVSYFDVTDSVRVENALREKAAALEAAERLKLDFLANVSYQLRTPLNAIMGFSEILDHQYFGDLNDRQKEYTGGIQEAGQRLLNLIDDILDLSTIEAGYMSLSPDEFSVYDMLKTLGELTQDWARKQRIEVKLNCPRNIGSMHADERRIKQVLLNLIRNAINFTPEGGTITLNASRKKDMIELIVSDTGVGIPKEEQERIFEPFERAQSRGQDQNAGSRGAGLGLSLVKNIVALHGGTIDLDSTENQGTTVNISLPLLSENVL